MAETLLARGGSPGRALKGLAWDVVAEVSGAPVVVPEVLDPAVAQRQVEDAGGAAAVARVARDGGSGEDVEALCVPFGRLDDERASVVRTSAGYGDQVWTAALRAATYQAGRCGSAVTD